MLVHRSPRYRHAALPPRRAALPSRRRAALPPRRAAVSHRRRRAAGFAAAIVLALTACAGDGRATDAGTASDRAGDGEVTTAGASDPTSNGDLTVVVTTSILGDVVGALVGNDGEVTVLLPPGTDPHGFEPSAADAAALRGADLVVANGLHLEEGLLDMIHAAQQEGVEVLEVAEHLDPIPFDGDGPDTHADDQDGDHRTDDADDADDAETAADDAQTANDDTHDDANGLEDPHVWFDPVRMADGVELIVAELAAVDTGLGEAEWQARGAAYAAELLEVHEQMEAMFATIPAARRKLVTNHDALGYLAHRYGFEVLGTVVPGSSTQADANPGQFADLVATVDAAGVATVFAENTDATVLAEQLASEVVGRSDVEVEVVRLYTDALGEPGSGAETYLDLLRTDAELITAALR